MLKKLIVSLCLFGTISCAEDKLAPSVKEYDGTLLGEWVEDDGNSYVHGYLCFYSDGTGISGSYEPNIDWVNEDNDIEWYSVNDKYLYIDGAKYEYSCDGSTLELSIKGRTRYYYEK